MTMIWPPKPSAEELSSPSIFTLRDRSATSARSSTVLPSTVWRSPKCSCPSGRLRVTVDPETEVIVASSAWSVA